MELMLAIATLTLNIINCKSIRGEEFNTAEGDYKDPERITRASLTKQLFREGCLITPLFPSTFFGHF